ARGPCARIEGAFERGSARVGCGEGEGGGRRGDHRRRALGDRREGRGDVDRPRVGRRVGVCVAGRVGGLHAQRMGPVGQTGVFHGAEAAGEFARHRFAAGRWHAGLPFAAVEAAAYARPGLGGGDGERRGGGGGEAWRRALDTGGGRGRVDSPGVADGAELAVAGGIGGL